MDIEAPTALLGGLSPQAFMRRHWQKKPLLVRQAWAGATAPVSRSALFELAARDDVESRLIQQREDGWALRRGPLSRRALPPVSRPGWTLLVQGLDLHVPAAHELLSRFRFVPQARLDDLMISYATDGGGVGPHVDAYDVFLLQVQGRRRWRVGRVPHPQWVDGAPLKLLSNFEPETEWVLEPGDMLYLPPLWGHDGVAEGECMTCSVGFQAPAAAPLAHDMLQHMIDGLDTDVSERLYRDPHQPATDAPGRIPDALAAFAHDAVQRVLREPDALACALGESLTEPKPLVWFDAGTQLAPGVGVQLDPRSRMMYDARHVFINGESFRAGGRDASLMRRLADRQVLQATEVARLGEEARALLDEWACAGWLRPLAA
ncbi:JmjC domain-containing protein [Ideonella sp. BN130291]|uniref:JmjC domain-containing protein n=1 Tax=Ideonella sp. BN130291 TaxID=3112940 RepID=UPI002E270B0C|nr:cupin domain-containing protein [Ideonella sp. BN130291]